MLEFFHAILYVPIYNLLIFLVDIIPGADIGLAVVLATIVVRLIMAPLSMAAQRTARVARVMQPELKAVRETYKDDKEEQAKQMFALYKKYGANPFAGLLVLIIQLPIVITLFWVFHSKTLLTVDPTLLYPFVNAPDAVNTLFLGVFLMTSSSFFLAALTALTQLAQAWYTIPVPPKAEKPSMQEDLGRAMAFQMRFILPFVTGSIAFTSPALALYFTTTNLISIIQEFFVRREKLPEAVGSK
ncbi:MAG TPA: YidC/Oxa1 family membrane protein insertase [Candidatus Paceibacterota bacterium]|nr:YidC/Oxa1 family membrane protein insertase [Candidatus Paceibacterota bacterium]